MLRSVTFKIVFEIMSQGKLIRAENGTLYSNVKNEHTDKLIRDNKQELLKLLNSIGSVTLKRLYDLYEERAGIIEYDGEYAREVAEKLALQDVIKLYEAAINNSSLPDTSIVLSYKENTEKPPPYWTPKKILKGISIESPKVKKILNEVRT